MMIVCRNQYVRVIVNVSKMFNSLLCVNFLHMYQTDAFR